MKLLDAVKTGRPFKRKGEASWYMVTEKPWKIGEYWIVLQGNATYGRYTRHTSREDDLAADDFEIQELEMPEWLK